MSTPSTEIERLLVLLAEGCEENAKLAIAAGEAEAAYRVAFAKSLLRSEGTSEGKRSAEATVACERLLFERKAAEAVYNANCEKLRIMRSSIDACRTLAANERAVTG